MPFVLLPAELTLWDIVQNLRPVPLAIVVILILFSLFSWTIVFSKGSVFSRARRENRNFLRAFRKAASLQAVAIASECPATEWATVEVREIGNCWEGNG